MVLPNPSAAASDSDGRSTASPTEPGPTIAIPGAFRPGELAESREITRVIPAL